MPWLLERTKLELMLCIKCIWLSSTHSIKTLMGIFFEIWSHKRQKRGVQTFYWNAYEMLHVHSLAHHIIWPTLQPLAQNKQLTTTDTKTKSMGEKNGSMIKCRWFNVSLFIRSEKYFIALHKVEYFWLNFSNTTASIKPSWQIEFVGGIRTRRRIRRRWWWCAIEILKVLFYRETFDGCAHWMSHAIGGVVCWFNTMLE